MLGGGKAEGLHAWSKSGHEHISVDGDTVLSSYCIDIHSGRGSGSSSVITKLWFRLTTSLYYTVPYLDYIIGNKGYRVLVKPSETGETGDEVVCYFDGNDGDTSHDTIYIKDIVSDATLYTLTYTEQGSYGRVYSVNDTALYCVTDADGNLPIYVKLPQKGEYDKPTGDSVLVVDDNDLKYPNFGKQNDYFFIEFGGEYSWKVCALLKTPTVKDEVVKLNYSGEKVPIGVYDTLPTLKSWSSSNGYLFDYSTGKLVAIAEGDTTLQWVKSTDYYYISIQYAVYVGERTDADFLLKAYSSSRTTMMYWDINTHILSFTPYNSTYGTQLITPSYIKEEVLLGITTSNNENRHGDNEVESDGYLYKKGSNGLPHDVFGCSDSMIETFTPTSNLTASQKTFAIPSGINPKYLIVVKSSGTAIVNYAYEIQSMMLITIGSEADGGASLLYYSGTSISGLSAVYARSNGVLSNVYLNTTSGGSWNTTAQFWAGNTYSLIWLW